MGWPLLVAGELVVGGAYVVFVLVRMANPDLWQPWYGGEKFMEFAFLNGILRSPAFPPVDPHFAGGFINYYYFGIYLASYLIKLTGIYAEVAFNLTIAALFAITVSNAFSIAYSAWSGGARVRSWRSGFAAALLAPVFVAVLGNLDAFAQLARDLSERAAVSIERPFDLLSALPGLLVAAFSALAGRTLLPPFDFWAPSRVIPNTINEFPFWSFLFADLHPHLIGLPLAILFCGLLLALLHARPGDRRHVMLLLLAMAFLLGALSSVNLWELPTYLALGILGLAVSQFRTTGRVSLFRTSAAAALYAGLAYLAFYPFFRDYVNVGASGIGLVRSPDAVGPWLLIWGFFAFVAVSWLAYATARRPWTYRNGADACSPSGVERAMSMAVRKYDRLPRAIYLHGTLVRAPTFGYLLELALVPIATVAAILLIGFGQVVLGLCIVPLLLAWMLLWKRGTDSDPAALLVAVLIFTSISILAGTQVVFLRDFLEGGDWYRMNTLFKFFMQVWVLFGLATAIAVPRLWRALFPAKRPARLADDAMGGSGQAAAAETADAAASQPSWTVPGRILAATWVVVLILLFAASLTFTAFGTPARSAQRMTGWRPPFGTLNGMDYMRNGSYTWPDQSNVIELKYDWEAIRWLLDNVRGNTVIVESSEIDYYRAGSSRAASFTGISGLRGMHASEQRPGEKLAEREQLHREFWSTSDVDRTLEIIDLLDVSLVYAGQLERYLHPEGIRKLELMASQGRLFPLFENDGVTVYGVSGRLVERDDGTYTPAGQSVSTPG